MAAGGRGHLSADTDDLSITPGRTCPHFRFAGTPSESEKLLGRLPAPPQRGRGLLGVYGGEHDFPGKPYREEVYRTGLVLTRAMNIIREAGIDPDTYVPAHGATYPDNSFFHKVKQAAQLFKESPVRILGINIGGWDTHTNQGALSGTQPSLLNQVARAIQALSRDLRDQWGDVVVVTLTEFGRTSLENGSRGTDHAEATVVLVAGGSVNGAVYNCDGSTWPAGSIFSTPNGRYLAHRTDFRAIFAEIFKKHFGDDDATLDRVIPNLGTLRADAPSEFAELGIL